MNWLLLSFIYRPQLFPLWVKSTSWLYKQRPRRIKQQLGFKLFYYVLIVVIWSNLFNKQWFVNINLHSHCLHFVLYSLLDYSITAKLWWCCVMYCLFLATVHFCVAIFIGVSKIYFVYQWWNYSFMCHYYYGKF